MPISIVSKWAGHYVPGGPACGGRAAKVKPAADAGPTAPVRRGSDLPLARRGAAPTASGWWAVRRGEHS